MDGQTRSIYHFMHFLQQTRRKQPDRHLKHIKSGVKIFLKNGHLLLVEAKLNL